MAEAISMTSLAIKDKVKRLEECLIEEKTGFKALTRHYFSEGLYCREMAIPKGTVITGAEHLQGHMCIVTQGKCMVTSEEFTGVLNAGDIYVSKAGTKRAIFALTDLVWVTTHATDETNVDVIEQTLVK